MHFRQLIFSFFILINCMAFAQDQTMGKKERITFEIEKDSKRSKQKVLIIPFDNKMYMSEIDREIAEQNQLDFNQIRAKFRKGLNELLFIALNEKYKPFSMLYEDEDLQEDLKRIYYSLGYKYDVVEKTPLEMEQQAKNSSTQQKKLTNRKKSDSDTKSSIKKGEIITNPDQEVRFMNAVISNPSILEHLSRKYGAEILVVINQMDVKHSPDANVYTLSDNSSSREFKVHYTLMDIKGKQLAAGAAFASFPGNDNDINQIINASYPKLVKKILSELIQTPKSADELIRENPEIQKPGMNQTRDNK